MYQPHYQVIDRQDQAQLYRELVTAPPAEGPAVCGGSEPTGPFTTSFLFICGKVKENRLLPHGYLPETARAEIAAALGAGADLAEDAGAKGVGDDPDYVTGGGDSLVYTVPLPVLETTPTELRVTLSYQAIPPYYLQDRFCTAKGIDTQRL